MLIGGYGELISLIGSRGLCGSSATPILMPGVHLPMIGPCTALSLGEDGLFGLSEPHCMRCCAPGFGIIVLQPQSLFFVGCYGAQLGD